jgi:hypothetical protein
MKRAQRQIGLDPRRLRPARRREGAVLLIVLLMVMMATGTALYAMQATFYEQGASTSYADAAWTRSLAEGAAVGTFAVVEEDGIRRGSLTENLDQRWRDMAGVRSVFSTKYGTPTPLEGTAAPLANPDSARSIDLIADNAAFLSTPQGLTGFCMPVKWVGDLAPGAPPGIAPVPYDGLPLTSRRQSRCLAIYETWGGLGTGSSSTSAGVTTPPRPRTRSVITGIGETWTTADPPDPDGIRGLHETVGMARGYFDRLN